MKKYITYILLTLILTNCTEPYALQTEDFEDAIVVEATITNELKKHEVKITRTFPLEFQKAMHEENAIVYVLDDLGNRFDFEEVDKKYVSVTPFEAMPNHSYQLYITTSDGKSYSSSKENLPTITPIQDVLTRVITKDGQKGVEITANTTDPTNTSKYYRYQFTETSKVTSPKWNPYKLILLDQPRICPGPNFIGYESIGYELRGYESRTCYRTENSNNILITSTTNLSQDQVIHFPVRFIANTDYTIAERYSIEVTQFVQNYNAHSYYKTLKKISENGNLLSGNQPGLVKGNLKCITNSNENVLGLFEVASVSKKRIFFNFDELFPGAPIPKYFVECKEYGYDSMDFGKPDPRPNAEFPCGTGGQGTTLRRYIRNNTATYFRTDQTVIFLVQPICGDCTTIASNIKPLFWID
ncbi:DUF4249 domain-containing protein [Flavobacterium amnicola]|uniref:DUF4249 domain-containing protein n=1 Tax=Flavobacterium amnicola TaxID=2506422 RepID=A0A4Q1K506_9FLAO|nr:DUF4249 domain-containing protein [Flavobacterium amnicola]RXR20560.1 DUF4249 domain-containing protein [Flavobacterium amnicola]